VEPNALSRRKLLQSCHSFGSETHTASVRERASTRERERMNEKESSCEAESIQSKDCSEAAIQSVAKSFQSKEGNEKEEEEEEERETDRNKRIGAEQLKAFSRGSFPIHY
jgi:hypothetical protein